MVKKRRVVKDMGREQQKAVMSKLSTGVTTRPSIGKRTNQDVKELLLSFSKYQTALGDKWKSVAYRNAADSVDHLRGDINGMKMRLSEIPGIGKSISDKVRTYLDTGKSPELEVLKGKISRDKFRTSLYEIEGFGGSSIDSLYNNFRITNMEDLEAVLMSPEVIKIPGFGKKKAERLYVTLQEYKTGGIRRSIPYKEAFTTASGIVKKFDGAIGVGRIQIAGSLRRKKPLINDVDIVVSDRLGLAPATLATFASLRDVKRIVSKGTTRATVVLNNGIQVDMRVVPEKSYWTALQYFTGSKEHNVRLRAIAKDRGFLLSEYGLFHRKTKKSIPIRSEREIYSKIGVKYTEPEDR